jgi:hypothetical protein
MKITHVEIADDLATAAGQLWPDETWTEVVNSALGVAVTSARADLLAYPQPAEQPQPTVIDTSDTYAGIAAAIA